MSSRFYGSIGFSEGLSIQARKTKEVALERLENYFSAHPTIGAFIKDAVCEFVDEVEGLEGYSTEEILRAELPLRQIADLETFGFRFYPIAARI